MMFFGQGAFQASPSDTPETIAQKRAYIASMLPRFGSAKYVGEGLGQLATGVMVGRQNRKLNEAEGKGRESADALFGRLFGTANSAQSPEVTGPLSVLGMQGGAPQGAAGSPSGGGALPVDPNSPTALGDAAMAALGKPAMHDHATAHPGQSHGNWLKYSNQGATRNDPLDPKLVDAMSFLGDMGITMDVISGGQEAAGQGGSRTGSTRHDHGQSADADFYMGGRKLDWNNPSDLPILQEIVRTAKSRGVTGIGAGDDYMGPGRFHVGFGTPAVWGAGGKRANAPAWLAEAYEGAPAGAAPVASSGAAVAPQGGVPLAELQMALQNPWLSAEQKALIGGMIDQQTQAADPMAQIELQKAQLELQQMQNPEPAAPGFVTLSQQEVQQLGLPPGVYQRGPDGRIDTVEKTQGTVDDTRYQPVGGQIWDMRPDGGGPPQLVGGGTEEVIYGADGQPIVTRGPVGTSKPFTEGQSKDVVYSTRAQGALDTLDPIADALIDRGDVAAGWLPFGLGGGMQDDDFQVAKTAGDEFLQAILRKDTGAAITADEQALYGETYLPKPGDSPARLAYKKEARQRAVRAIEAGMSPAQIIAQERALSGGDAVAAPASASNADFSKMTIAEVGQVDIGSLTPEQMDALEKRMTELGL